MKTLHQCEAPGLAADVARIKRIEQLERELAEWKRCAAMFCESLNPPQGPSGEAVIDQQLDAEELFAKLCDGVPIVDQLAEANEYARKLSIKVTDQGVEIQRLQATIQRKQDAGDLLFEELDDKTPEPRCNCIPHGLPCLDCDLHTRSREAIKAWKEANK